MTRLGAFLFLSVVCVCDLLATKWEVADYENWSGYSTAALIIGLVLAAVVGFEGNDKS